MQSQTITLKDIIVKIKSLSDEVANKQLELKAYKIKLQDIFDKKDTKQLEVKCIENSLVGKKVHKILKATKVERLLVKYLPEKLSKKLDKEVFNKITSKTYTVTDMQGLVKLLKSKGIKPKDFKKFINVETKVDNAKIKQAFATGEITNKDIRGCYEAKISKSIQVTEKII